MKHIVQSWGLFFTTLLLSNPLLAQLNLRIDEHFFEGKEIKKVETTWDGYVWVLGANNFIARVSPDDQVEDFTELFAGYSTKPFTDISARVADTLLLGTEGDYAFLFTGGNIKQFGPSEGVDLANITGVAIPKQYYLPIYGLGFGGYEGMSLTAGWNTFWSSNGSRFEGGASTLNSTPQRAVTMHWWQNDRKGYLYTYHYDKNHEWLPSCYGREISDFEVSMPLTRGAGLQQAFVDQVGDSQSIRAAFYTPRVKLGGIQRPAFFWASEFGLNFSHQTLNCFDRSTPIPFFNGKTVTCISDINALAAYEYDYLSFLLVGTNSGLFVSSDSQKQSLFSDYEQDTSLGGLRINDLESINTGLPSEYGGRPHYEGSSICEQWLYVATANGLYKMNYSIAPASFSHIGDGLFLNGVQQGDTAAKICGGGTDMLSNNFVPDANSFIRWQRNGEDIVDSNTGFISLTEPGTYRAVMWFGCENIEIYTKEVTVELADTPVFTFDYPDTVDVCQGDVFPLEVTDVQPGYRYQWFRDGTPIDGEILPLFTVTEEGMYHVGVSACGDHFVFSDSIAVRFRRLEKPTTTDGNILVCQGQTRRLTVTGYAPDVIKRWYRDGVLLPSESDTVLVVTQPGAYSVELAIGSCSVRSDQLTVRFVAPPVAQIKATDEGPLCYGTSTILTADHTVGETYTYQWSTGETTRNIQASNPGVYTLVLTNATGCSDTTAITLQVYDPIPAPQIRDTVLCGATNETIRVEAPAGYSAYRWNGGASSGRYFDVSAPGTYSLEVQDEKGCTATTTFEVKPYCEDIIIPNTFSPNGDGFNDTWIIGGLEDRAAMVTVFDRNGQLVFQSRGYSVPWDGLYKGRLVPVGAYYYHIATSGGESFKGALNVLY